MEYRKAELPDLGTVFTLSQAAIRAAYPYYYPAAAVEWFAEHHSCERILADITAGQVRLLEVNGVAVGTGTIDGDRLLRVFVAPEQQGKGYGTRLLAQLEKEAARGHDAVILDSSLPSGRFFQNRGYRTRSHELFDIEDNHGLLLAILAWEVMEKPLHEKAAEAPKAAEADHVAPEAASVAAQPAAKPTAEATPSATPSENEPEPVAPTEQALSTVAESAAEVEPEPEPEPGTSTVRISAAAADVMKQLPQMPF